MKVVSRVVTGTLLAVALAVTGAPLASLAPAPAPAPAGAAVATVASTAAAAARLYTQAFATTRAWSVHYTSSSTQTTTSGAKLTLLESGDAGPASGTQSVAFSNGTVKGSISIEVIGDITYVKGDANGLITLAGLNPLQAGASAGKWVDFSTTDSAFSQVVAGVRSHDIAAELALSGPLSLGHPRTLDGVAVLAVEGTQAQSASGAGNGTHVRVVLYVRARGRHLPVEEDAVNTKGQPTGAFRVTYSNWGERVRPQAPMATITLGPVTTT